MNETALATTEPKQDIASLLVALNPAQMITAQANMIGLSDQRIAEQQVALEDLEAARKHAENNNWATSTYDRTIARTKKVIEYYTKIKAALAAGYCIIPDIPLSIVAIRTADSAPKQDHYTPKEHGNYHDKDRQQQAQVLPQGEGRYVSPNPNVRSWDVSVKGTDGKSVPAKQYFSDGHGEVGFPFVGVKPAVVGATSDALKQLLFDEIGMLPGSPQAVGHRRDSGAMPTRQQDPIIVGRIIDPRSSRPSTYASKKAGVRNGLSFMIAWWFRPEDL